MAAINKDEGSMVNRKTTSLSTEALNLDKNNIIGAMDEGRSTRNRSKVSKTSAASGGSGIATSSASSSVTQASVFSNGDFDELKRILPYVAGIKGAMHIERVNSFMDNKWPWVDPTRQLCNPDELAMAGFMWCKEEMEPPCIMCFACDLKEDVNSLSPESDPWDTHKQLNPNCPYIKLGKRKLPREYKFKEIFTILVNKKLQRQVNELVRREKQTLEDIRKLIEFEDEEETNGCSVDK